MKRLVLVSAVLLAGCGSHESAQVRHGRQVARDAGCGACHHLSGVRGADGRVGPSLQHFGTRRSIAGAVPNTTVNLVRWLRDPQALQPRTLMPDLELSVRDARAIAAYLEDSR